MITSALIFCTLATVSCDKMEIQEVREITAYNVGVVWQNDDEPCIGATGENLCEALERGESICASNFVPLGTILTIEDYGACRVADRTSRKYGDRVDIAMPQNEIKEALNWGRRNKLIRYFK